MIASPQQESEIMAQLLSLRDDPLGFAHYAYPWGKPGTPFVKGLRRWQEEELDLLGQHVREQVFAVENEMPLKVWKSSYASGRGPGKSALFGITSHWHASTHIGAPTIVAANTETQLVTKTFPEFAVWFGAGINAHWWTIERSKIGPAPWLLDIVRRLPQEGGLGIEPKYWYVQGQTWSEDNPDAFAGAHNPYGMMLLFDEASGIPSKIWEVAEGFFTEVGPYRFHIAASQMRSRKGRFYELFNDPNMSIGWRTRTISTRGMDGVDQAVVEDQIKRYGIDSDFVRVEILGLAPRTSEDQFISWDAVRAAQQNKIPHDYGEPLIMGVDPAPRGRTVIQFRQGRNARDCVGPQTRVVLDGADNIQIAERVLKLDQQFKPDAICIDFGMGTGVIDIVKRKRTHGRLHEVKFGMPAHDKDGEYATRSIELWAKLRDWLPGGQIIIDNGEKHSLSDQLTNRGWRWSGREDHKKILETKEDMQSRGVASPDDADALACTFHVDPPRRDFVRQGRGAVAIADGIGKSMFDEN